MSNLVLPPLPTIPSGIRRRAAVAIVAGPGDDLLLIRRATREGDPWSGDMAFPGGREQPDDPGLRHTAERETFEEVGLDLGRATFVGALDLLVSPLRDPSGTFGVVPFVYVLPDWPALTPNGEVASTHILPLHGLVGEDHRSTFTYRGYGIVRELPCVRLDGTFVWGMTLRMLDGLGEALARCSS